MASQLPPASPKTVLRGHQAQVHAAAFVRRNQRLASGDAEGYVVLWDLTIMRPRAVWRAHTNAILGIASWGVDKVITHGRDNKLIVWKVKVDDEAGLSTTLPLDPSPVPRPQPWILHILEVNTMNFCSFGSCSANPDGTEEELLIAVPNTLASESVDVYHLPSQERLHTVQSPEKADKSGMVMSLALFYVEESLTLVIAYENGLATVTQLQEQGSWNLLYRAQSHSQPVLSLDVAPNREYFWTSGADAVLAKHPIPRQTVSTQDSSPKTQPTCSTKGPTPSNGKYLLSAALSGRPGPAKTEQIKAVELQTQALKIINTKHSGQQSLRVRSDGKILATAGWDAKIRVYSAQTMRELAVLKWHQVGCYAVAFASLVSLSEEIARDEKDSSPKGSSDGGTVAIVPKLEDATVKDRRIKQSKEAHWLAAGSKDGKISLWDIY
ncbi:WD40-repeat-containing domain protein [Xylariales sp. AK1849]|nr:WD40-repeat-containing domain protein [Xylariales sp. AK1849]